MSERKPVVLVTGANGFVGRHVVPALTRAGWSVRRAVRSPEGTGDEVVIETIGPETDWTGALDGVDAVVHLAARVHHKHEEHAVQLYRNVNIAGTLHLARSAATAGVRQFIFVSTVLVHGRSNEGRAPFSESDILTPRGLYGMSKAAAEEGLRTLARDSDMKISVIRPPLVYGAGAKGNFALLTRAVDLGLPLPFGAIRNHRAFLAVQNLSSFILRRLTHPDPAGNFDIFLVADREQVSTPEFITRLADASGKRLRLFGVPTSLLTALLNVTGRQDAHDSLIGSLELNISKAIATGWQPEVSLDEGLRLALSAQDD
ncbi:NAD-dependent epimerase/dehydratase family protein [Bradyrhizobium diazoefficiens]|jgi:UDP-glucose 4-epimerase|uniref:NAD-dependent epimerase/dehydratase family protein n=1 Tax=Bradyrhizobium sp. WYCCWR 12699 TaxID=3064203 RepID=UPI001B8A7E96|nr:MULTISPECIES: NAD-dependent epimerase/dehydratase family protein [Bradyrhizobium]MBR0704271.1 NAD-dependent epimerase/dehydratase family protein [Bradyrhizobium diazoefficiens]MBR0772709.1 NAD-dependent epimerase/dehydratase family protein [Bradyrhizobium diazoefficiens]MDT4740777.1 NAD-dependent epimerase/dehydratase family protein [Bradyrhizobium sp. WYCCWR 12699]